MLGMLFPQIRYHSAQISIGVNQYKQPKSLSIKISEDLKPKLVGYYRNRPALDSAQPCSYWLWRFMVCRDDIFVDECRHHVFVVRLVGILLPFFTLFVVDGQTSCLGLFVVQEQFTKSHLKFKLYCNKFKLLVKARTYNSKPRLKFFFFLFEAMETQMSICLYVSEKQPEGRIWGEQTVGTGGYFNSTQNIDQAQDLVKTCSTIKHYIR